MSAIQDYQMQDTSSNVKKKTREAGARVADQEQEGT